MSTKSAIKAAPEKASHSTNGIKHDAGAASRLENPLAGLQHALGNQAMLQLLESGAIQAKLRVSQPGDADELEADQVAEKVVAAARAPAIQRKCACDGGAPCAKCTAEPADETIHRSVAVSQLRSLGLSIQRSPADVTSTADRVPAASEKQLPGAKTSATLVVEDNATKVEPHQMRKSQFIALLRTDACAAADHALASVNHTTKGCPYVAKWLSFYEQQSGQHIEQAIRKYAPDAAKARSAREAIRILAIRIERAAVIWARTGSVEGVPKELASQAQGQGRGQGGTPASDNSVANSKNGGTKKSEVESGELQRKAYNGEAAPARDAAAVKAQLGSGHSLDSRAQSQMSSAFGHNFSAVRVHTDSSAAELSSDLNARAFTIGSDVAFASGEYRPGTLIGDALIAHELAHVVQQSAGNGTSGPMMKGAAEYSALEADADTSALRATVFVWGRESEAGRSAVTQRSRLRLQRCGGEPDKIVLGKLSPAERKKFAKGFVDRNFSPKDREAARKILDDMLQSGEVSFKDDDALRTEIFKRIETTKFMQQSQALFGKAFEYPNHKTAKACLPNNTDGKLINPRVNKAAEPYWGPVQDSQGDYHWDLSESGKKNAYKALTTLFTPQKSICDMTLIHCDYLASVVHFRAFAESIGIEEFNKRVQNGDIEMRLAWNGFQDLEDIGWSHSKKSISLREVRPANEEGLVIGDHVVFWNHRAYDALNLRIGNAWRLENAILVYRRGKEDHFLGHGSGDNTNETMRRRLALEYNIVIKKATDIIDETKSKNSAEVSKAAAKMAQQFPNLTQEAHGWVIHAKSKTFKVEPITWSDPDLTGLRSPDDPSKMNCVKRPAEAPGESC